MKKFVVATLLMSLAVPIVSAQTPQWNVLMEQGYEAAKNNDLSFALYKLRKAWFAIPDKNLDSKSHKAVKLALIEVMKLHKSRFVKTEAIRMQEQYSMEEIDLMLKRREFNGSGEQYSVELKQDGSLAFSMNGLDTPYGGEPICTTYLSELTKEEKKKLSEELLAKREIYQKAHESSQQELRSRMPIVFKPDSPKYKELLSLCQPIKAGEKKEQTGFDLSPFVPMDLPRTPDI